MEATGTWPGRQRGDKHALEVDIKRAGPALILASGAKVYDRSLFNEPPMDMDMPLEIDRKTRRIFGSDAAMCRAPASAVSSAFQSDSRSHFTGVLERSPRRPS